MLAILDTLLRPLGVYLLAAGLLAGVHSLLAAAITGWLRRRRPTIEARQAYLLRGSASFLPRLGQTQRLEGVRQGRWLAVALTFFPVVFLGEVLCRWLGVLSPDRTALKIELVGLCACSPLVFGAAYAAARARLAGDVLGSVPSSPPAPSV